MSLRRKLANRAKAAADRGVAKRLAGLSRAGQVARSTVPVGESDLPVVETLETVVDTAEVLPGVIESADQAGSDAYDAAIRVDEAQAVADGAAADALAAAQVAADANAAASAAGSAAAAAQTTADDATAAAAQAAQDATDKSAAAEAAAKAYADAEAEAARLAAIAAASGDATAKADAAEAAAKSAAAADASAKANAAEAAAKADAAAAQSTADQAVSDAAAAQSAADAAQGAANDVRFLAEGLYQAIPSVTAPTASPSGPLKQGDMWFQIGATGTNVEGKFIGVQVWDGAQWVPREMLADSLMVVGPDGVVYVANGKVTADALAVDALDFKTATGMNLTAGEIIGALIKTAASGQRLQMDSGGFKSFKANGALAGTIKPTPTGFAIEMPNGAEIDINSTVTGGAVRVTSDAASSSLSVENAGIPAASLSADIGSESLMLQNFGTAARLFSNLPFDIAASTTQSGNTFALKSQLDAWAPIDGTHAWVESEAREYVRAGGAWVVAHEDTGWVDLSSYGEGGAEVQGRIVNGQIQITATRNSVTVAANNYVNVATGLPVEFRAPSGLPTPWGTAYKAGGSTRIGGMQLSGSTLRAIFSEAMSGVNIQGSVATFN